MGKVDELTELIKTKHYEWINLTVRDLSKISGYKQWACAEALKTFNIKEESNKTQTTKQKSIPPQNTTQDPLRFIDDPNELLLSTAIRELNKPKPDPRWANILIACKKEKITNKGDDIESFRKLPNEILANLLNKSKLKTS